MKNSKKVSLTPQEIESRLKDAGVQPTLQRISICRFILCEATHPTADDIHRWAEQNLAKISLATVYNTLNTLVGAGLLREYKFAHMDKVVYDDNLEEHAHFLDETSGKLFDIHKENIKLGLQLASEFNIKSFDLLIRGQMSKKLKQIS